MYTGVGYDVDGNPTVASRLEADQRFDADGPRTSLRERRCGCADTSRA
jgi:hypothetical protein